MAGTTGYSEHSLLEKWARDSKILDIFEGTQQIQLLVVASLLGLSSAELKVPHVATFEDVTHLPLRGLVIGGSSERLTVTSGAAPWVRRKSIGLRYASAQTSARLWRRPLGAAVSDPADRAGGADHQADRRARPRQRKDRHHRPVTAGTRNISPVRPSAAMVGKPLPQRQGSGSTATLSRGDHRLDVVGQVGDQKRTGRPRYRSR